MRVCIQTTLEIESRHETSSEYRRIMDTLNVLGLDFRMTMPYAEVGMSGNLLLVANFHTIPDDPSGLGNSTRPIFSYSTVIQPRRDANRRISFTPHEAMRPLTHIARTGVNYIQLCVQLSTRGAGCIIIDSTCISRIPDIMPSDLDAVMQLTIPGSSNSPVTQYDTPQSSTRMQLQLLRNSGNGEITATSFIASFSRTGVDRQIVLEDITWYPVAENMEIYWSDVMVSTVS
jgi:hypothetical protein